MMTRATRFLVLAALLLGAAAARAGDPALPTLRPGEPAPALKVAKWFKGTPVTEFKQGDLYVVEFWSTWCGPCKAAIPHLTELAKKYDGKITFIGVDVWEHPKDKTNEALAAIAAPFVEAQGDKMGYNVAGDDIDGTMATTWLKAAGRNGIPCSMVVGRDGEIAWIGHPMQLDKPLEQLVAGTFDVKASAEEFVKGAQEAAANQKLLEPIMTARRAKDGKALLAALDKAVAEKPAFAAQFESLRFEALLFSDEAAAYEQFTQTEPKNFRKLYPMWMTINQNASGLKSPPWDKLADTLAKASEASPQDFTLLSASAEALARSGRVAQAIAVQKELIKKLIDLSTRINVAPAWIETQKAKLAQWEAQQPK